MRLRTIFALWLPLAVSFELMMLEGPAVQAAIGRLPQAPLNLAAWGLTMSLSLLVESPVIMLLATAIALVRDGDSYRALRRFTLIVLTACTLLTGLVAFTPLFDLVAAGWMRQPGPMVDAARPAMRIMLFWTAAIAWRRFHQGVLVRHGFTQKVSLGTAIRLFATVAAAALLVQDRLLPGVQVGAVCLMVAVVTEAVATTLFARPILRRVVLPVEVAVPMLSQRDILRFHAPLALTTLLTLLAQPMTAAALARLDHREITLAVWPVVGMLLLVMRGFGFALQEITVAQASDPGAGPALARFTWIVGLVSSGATALLACTPLLGRYLESVLRLDGPLHAYAYVGVAAGCLLPLLTALGSWARGRLVAMHATRQVYHGMALNLATHALLLMAGVLLRLPGMLVAGPAFVAAAAAEYLFLASRARRLATQRELAPAPVLATLVIDPEEALAAVD